MRLDPKVVELWGRIVDATERGDRAAVERAQAEVALLQSPRTAIRIHLSKPTSRLARGRCGEPGGL